MRAWILVVEVMLALRGPCWAASPKVPGPCNDLPGCVAAGFTLRTTIVRPMLSVPGHFEVVEHYLEKDGVLIVCDEQNWLLPTEAEFGAQPFCLQYGN